MAVKHYVTSGLGFEPASYFLTLGLGFGGTTPEPAAEAGGALPSHGARRTIIIRRRRFEVDEESLEDFERAIAARLEAQEGPVADVLSAPPERPERATLSAAFRGPAWQPIELSDLPLPLNVVEAILKSIETRLRERRARTQAVTAIVLLTS